MITEGAACAATCALTGVHGTARSRTVPQIPVLRLRDPWAPGATNTPALRQINELIHAQLATGEFPQLAAVVGDDDPAEEFARMAHAMTDDARFERGLDGFERTAPRKRKKR